MQFIDPAQEKVTEKELMRARHSGTFLLLLVGTMLIVSYATANQGITEIRDLYLKINMQIASGANSCLRYVATTEGYETRKWSRVDSDTEFNKKKYYARATACFLQGGYLARVAVEVFSEAGDWADLREHYYYENGRLAFLFERQSTAQAYDNINNREIPGAPYILERRHYFDRKGVPLRKLDKAFASKGQQEFPVSFVYPIDFEIYKSVDELPFAAKK